MDRKRFTRTLAAGGQRQQNSHPAARKAKAEIRAKVLAAIQAAGRACVFDAFAGDGTMFRMVWQKAEAYVGCDRRWYRDEREAFVADNRRVMRAIDLVPFNVFDFDAYGSPWEQAVILAARRPVAQGERVGLVLTEGSGLSLKLGSPANALKRLAGLSRGMPATGRTAEAIAARAIKGLCERMRCRVTHRWQAAGKTGASVRYIGLVLEGL